MKIRLKIMHKVFLFSVGLVFLVIGGVIYLNNKYLEDFYATKRVAQIREVRKELSQIELNKEIIEMYEEKYNITINLLRKPSSKSHVKYTFDNNKEGHLIYKNRGMEHLEFYKVLDSGELLSLRVSTDSIKSTVGIVNEFFIYSGIAILLVSFIFIIIFSKKITKPVVSLNEIIQGMVNMNFSYRANIKTGDELEELGDNINFLAFELEKNIGELKVSNNKLIEEIKKIEKIDELRQEFIASITHEIKTPVTVINTHAEMLLYDLVEKAEEQKSYLSIIISEGENINGLLNELIKLIKLEEKIIDIKKEKLNIKNLLLEESNKYMIDLKEKNVTLKFDFVEKLLVIGDEFKIRQVLTNLISNAVSYVKVNGELQIILKKIENKAKIEIINTGENIPEDKIENIWKAFYRVEESRNKKYGGTGLGLTIVSGILERHGSKFGVENITNGVKFWFTLELGG